MAKYIVRSVRAGFGVTILPREPLGNVLKYYIEPEIYLEVPAEASSPEELQQTLDSITSEVIGMIQKSIKKKVLEDKEKRNQPPPETTDPSQTSGSTNEQTG